MWERIKKDTEDLSGIVNRLEDIKEDIVNRLFLEKVSSEVTSILMDEHVPLSSKIRKSLLRILDFIDAEKGSVMLINQDNKNELVVVEALSNGEGNVNIIGAKQRIGNNISSWVVKNKEFLLIEDINKDKRFQSTNFKINYRSNSLLSVPLIDTEKKVIGVLNITDKFNNSKFTKNDIDAAIIFSDRITPTISYSILNEQLKKKNEELEKLQQIKGDLTNMVIHDIKGHLGEIISNIDILKRCSELSDIYKDCIDSACVGCSSLLRLVLNLLDISKMEEGKIRLKYTTFDIVDICRCVSSKVATLAQSKGVTITIKADDNVPDVTAEKQFIERIVDNLLLNAINYTRDNTTITISVYLKKDDVAVSISDMGTGVPEEYKEKIFEKFEQTDKDTARYSTGLGLTFCKMAVSEHHGDIWVDSREGEGSTFTFTIPLISTLSSG